MMSSRTSPHPSTSSRAVGATRKDDVTQKGPSSPPNSMLWLYAVQAPVKVVEPPRRPVVVPEPSIVAIRVLALDQEGDQMMYDASPDP